MTTLFVILVLVACVILSAIVLIQNPKGGGLAGNVAGFSNQFMGVKQTTDVLEKGTWIFAAAIAILCITSAVFVPQPLKKTPRTEQSPTPTNPNAGGNTPKQ